VLNRPFHLVGGLHATLVTMTARSLALSLALLFATALAGLAIRFAHLELPLCVVKYGGSMLWALMIYWIVSSLLPLWRMIPKYRIQSEIDSGDFLELPLPDDKTRDVRLNLVCRDLSASNPEVTALAELLGMNDEPQRV